MKRKHIKPLPIIDYSGFHPKHAPIPFVKKHQYFIITNVTMTGDAPKDFICYYHYGIGRKSNPTSWPRYIAKHGHKHYPVEAITEHLLNRIGTFFGFNIAPSELAYLGGQIRFLSKYFLDKPNEQILEHGADLYAGYLNDKEFVEEIEKKHKSPEFFTVRFTQETIKHFFPDDYERLMNDFIKLLVFDALIGNNDRHFYNWGIIRNLKSNEPPKFSPIYDTARGLFWNDHEDKIQAILKDKVRLQSTVKKYCNSSTPKIGWEGVKILNHFQLVEHLCTLEITRNCETIKKMCSNILLDKVFKMMDNEFTSLISHNRMELIKITLQYRFDIIQKTLTFAP
jgi:hypothetical protein